MLLLNPGRKGIYSTLLKEDIELSHAYIFVLYQYQLPFSDEAETMLYHVDSDAHLQTIEDW